MIHGFSVEATGAEHSSVDDDVCVGTILPGGTVTLVFTDIEGSTRLLHELGAEAYARRPRRAPPGAA